MSEHAASARGSAAGPPTAREDAAGAHARAAFPSYGLLRICSFVHTGIYLVLLFLWIAPGFEGTLKTVFGYGHGIGWILMTLLSLLGLHRRTISITMAAVISIGGAVGPFVGSATFLYLDRRRRR